MLLAHLFIHFELCYGLWLGWHYLLDSVLCLLGLRDLLLQLGDLDFLDFRRHLFVCFLFLFLLLSLFGLFRKANQREVPGEILGGSLALALSTVVLTFSIRRKTL